jgi:LemA protein
MPFLTTAILLFAAAIYVVIVYNGLVRLQNEMGRAWANIDVLLKQRHDEIPNLVASVKGFMDHERQTIERVAQARAVAGNAASISQKAQADMQVTGALRSFFAVAEGYPQLKANQNFLALQARISGLEERIADRREFFNDDVNAFNTRIAQLPDLLLARCMKLQPRPMFLCHQIDGQPATVDGKVFVRGQGGS